MATMSATSQYATGSARERIERALQAAGTSVDSLNQNDLAPIEHFHTLGLRATEALVQLAGITAQDRVLDAGGERCQAHHVGLLQSGTMHVVHDDGTEQEIRSGQAYVIEPGHDAWVVGDEAVVGFEFDSRTAEEYAKG